MKATAKTIQTVDIKGLTICAMSIALTYVATAFINIRLPFQANGGLIHLGNVVLFVVAALFGRRTGAIAGALGMGLFDLLSGWTAWAPFTFIIVGLMGYVVGLINEKTNSILWNIPAFVLALGIKIAGYYIAEGVIYGNWVAPAASIPGNIIQIAVGAVIAFPIIGVLKKVIKK